MTVNYDTTVIGKPYRRIDRIVIDYTGPFQGVVKCNEAVAIRLAENLGVAKLRDSREVRAPIDPSVATKVYQLVNPDTGEDIPGATMTGAQIMLGILAFVREAQKADDSQNPENAQGD